MRGDIRNWQKALESRVNWGWLAGCFGNTRISPEDVDFLVERNGHFLLGEIKPAQDAVGTGQEIVLQQLAMLPQFTCFCLTGSIRNHEITPSTIFLYGRDVAPRPATHASFRLFVSAWFADAERRPLSKARFPSPGDSGRTPERIVAPPRLCPVCGEPLQSGFVCHAVCVPKWEQMNREASMHQWMAR